MKKKTAFSTLILLAISLPCAAVFFEVPDDFATIGEAVYYSGQGDTILVHPGIYRERLILPGHDFLLVSDFYFSHDSSDLYNTVIDASDFAEEDTASVLTFVHGNSRATVVSGFILRGGHGFTHESGRTSGGAIFITGSHPMILSNVITENESHYFAAISTEFSHPHIANNHIYGNQANESGLIYFGYDSDLDEETIFEWNDISQNYGPHPDWPYLIGDIIYVNPCGVRIRFNRFHDYRGTWALGGLFYHAWGELVGNRFERLTYEPFPGADTFAEIVHLYHSRITLRDNLFLDCLVSHPAIRIQNRPQAVPCQIERNWFENIRNIGWECTALNVLHASATIRDNVFIQCVGDIAGAIGIFFGQQGWRATIEGNHFFANQNFWQGEYHAHTSALRVTGTVPFSCTVRNNWFEGNRRIAVDLEHYSDPQDLDCRENYWGDPSGPYHPTQNPEGRGDTVGDHVLFEPWLTEPPTGSNVPSLPFALSPQDWKLEGAFPNPFNSTTQIRLISSRPQPFEVMVFNLLGQRVRRLWRGIVPKDSGVSVSWNGRDEYGQAVATGLYFVVATPQLSSTPHPKVCKVLCLR